MAGTKGYRSNGAGARNASTGRKRGYGMSRPGTPTKVRSVTKRRSR